MPKAPGSDKRQERRHNPLSEEYIPSQNLKQKAPKKRKSRTAENEDHFVDSKASRRILGLGQELADEEEAEAAALRPQTANPAFDFESRFAQDVESDDDDGIPAGADDDEGWGDEEEEEVEEIEVDPEDLAMFNKFNPEFDPATLLGAEADDEDGAGTNLADLILEKIAEHEAQQGQERVIMGGGAPEDAVEIPGKVAEVYTQYVENHFQSFFPSRYTSTNTTSTESASSSPATSQANSPNLSRLSQPSHNGTLSSA